MKYLDAYIKRIDDKGNLQLAKAVRETADAVDTLCLDEFSFVDQTTGLLFGNVQSGKTAQLFGIICRAADEGFPVFVLLTTDNVALQQQTLDRVNADLSGFCICGENDVQRFSDNNLKEPVIVVLKKNAHILRKWANIMLATGYLRGNPLLIADDEADAASLNTLVNQDKESSVYKQLNRIRNASPSGVYLEITGTPQALLLQTETGRMKPQFVYYFKPGPGYLGGNFFFPSDSIPRCIRFIEEEDQPLKSAVVTHLASAAIMLEAGGSACNALFHPGVQKAQHNELSKEISGTIQALSQQSSEASKAFQAELEKAYVRADPKNVPKASFDKVLARVRQLVKSAQILMLNSESSPDAAQYDKGCNFIVGGNKLGRGITFPALQTVYYTRTTKRPQADTMWQHSRMFGYDRDPGLMNLFLGHELYKLFSDINATNEAIIEDVESGKGHPMVFYPDSIKPTRANVLDNAHVSVISGGTNYYPADPKNASFEEITTLLEKFKDGEPYYQVSCKLILEILGHIVPSEDFALPAFLSAINAVCGQTATKQCILLVRRNRDVAQWTGALLSPNDWKLGREFSSQVVLTMYQVTGTKGWGGRPLWVPNIKLPAEQVYYFVEDDQN